MCSIQWHPTMTKAPAPTIHSNHIEWFLKHIFGRHIFFFACPINSTSSTWTIECSTQTGQFVPMGVGLSWKFLQKEPPIKILTKSIPKYICSNNQAQPLLEAGPLLQDHRRVCRSLWWLHARSSPWFCMAEGQAGKSCVEKSTALCLKTICFYMHVCFTISRPIDFTARSLKRSYWFLPTLNKNIINLMALALKILTRRISRHTFPTESVYAPPIHPTLIHQSYSFQISRYPSCERPTLPFYTGKPSSMTFRYLVGKWQLILGTPSPPPAQKKRRVSTHFFFCNATTNIPMLKNSSKRSKHSI